MDPQSEIEMELKNIQENHLWRNLSIRNGVDFSSNDYLGMSRSRNVQKALIEFLEELPSLGATGSRLISGENEIYQNAEAMIAKLFETESALIFGSGYLANLGLMTTLGSIKNSEFFSDALNHASLIDGMKLTKKPIHVFDHQNFNQLEELLKKSNSTFKIIVSESVFSMRGDATQISILLDLAEKYHAFIVIDEAHATGVCGPNGLGLSYKIHYKYPNIASIHTCGKALGAYGAFILSSKTVRDLLINKARSLIYSTGLPPILIFQIKKALQECQNQKEKSKLEYNIQYIKNQFKLKGLTWNTSHIGFVSIPCNEKVQSICTKLIQYDFNVRAIRSPTVPTGEEGIRITLKSFLTEKNIQDFTDKLYEILYAERQ